MMVLSLVQFSFCAIFFIFSCYAVSSAPEHPAAAIVDIQQTLTLFAYSVDTQDYSLLASVFTPDVTANFSEPGAEDVVGLPALQAALKHSLTGLKSQHTLDTLQVQFASDKKATATMYLVATFFGQGNFTGQAYINNGIYRDEMVEVGGGKWMSKRKTMQILVSAFSDVKDDLIPALAKIMGSRVAVAIPRS